MARSEGELLRDMLALVRDLKMDRAENKALVDEVTAHLAAPTVAPPKPPKPAPAPVVEPPKPAPAPARITIKRD